MERNKEKEPREGAESSKESERDESGYSESQSAMEAEVKAGEWQRIRKFKTFQDRTRQGKIILMYQAVSNRLNQLVSLYYQLVAKDTVAGEKLLQELRKLRYMQDVLLQCLVWEPKGELKKGLIPTEVWELIK